MVPLVRAGTLEKEGLGVGLPEDASIPFPTRHILKSLPLSGPTLTWHTGTCLSPPIHSATSASLSLRNQIPHSLPPGSFPALVATSMPSLCP